MRIGHGYDAHVFGTDCELVLGGVTIPWHQGLLAHSDGDVVIHALCDALLGAMCLGDIGCFFSDTTKELKGVDSRILLREVVQLIGNKQFRIVNVDITIVAQVPQMFSYIVTMRQNLATDMHVDITDVNVKATTTDGMGCIGRQEGIATHVVALIASI